MKFRSLLIALLGLVSAAGPARLIAQPVAPTVAGWYQTEEGRGILVSPAPDSGYRYLDFAHAEFGPLTLAREDSAAAEGARLVTDDEGLVQVLEFIDGRSWSRLSDAPYDLREVSFSGADGVALTGLVLRPRRAEIGAVVIHGSGDSDRDNVWAYTFAHALADAGVCVLFPDKRGSGASSGDWREVGLDALARDAVAGARELAGECGLSTDRIGWLGLSQGGWVAALAHRFSGGGAFQVSVSAAAVEVFEQMEHETINTLEASGLGGEALDTARRLVTSVRGFATGVESWSRYTALRDSLVGGPVGSFARALPADSTDWRWKWWNRVGRIDPVESWAQSAVPVLVVYGSEDEADNVPVQRSVFRLEDLRRSPGSPALTLRVYEGLGHTLVDEQKGWIDDEVLTEIGTWVHQVAPLP